MGPLVCPTVALIVMNMIVVVLFGRTGDTPARQETPLLFPSTFLMFVLVGAGRYSLDALIRKRH